MYSEYNASNSFGQKRRSWQILLGQSLNQLNKGSVTTLYLLLLRCEVLLSVL